MVFNATFNNISVISWRSILLIEETEVPGENHLPVVSLLQTLSHNVERLTMNGIRTHILVVIGSDCTGNRKSNYHTITTTKTHDPNNWPMGARKLSMQIIGKAKIVKVKPVLSDR
jgi:hypothetical protein